MALTHPPREARLRYLLRQSRQRPGQNTGPLILELEQEIAVAYESFFAAARQERADLSDNQIIDLFATYLHGLAYQGPDAAVVQQARDAAAREAETTLPQRREAEAVRKTVKAPKPSSLKPAKERIEMATKQRMRTVSQYLCDSCDRTISRPSDEEFGGYDGFVIKGNIYVADPAAAGGLVGDNFPDAKAGEMIDPEAVHQTVLCKECMLKALGLPAQLTLARPEDKSGKVKRGGNNRDALRTQMEMVDRISEAYQHNRFRPEGDSMADVVIGDDGTDDVEISIGSDWAGLQQRESGPLRNETSPTLRGHPFGNESAGAFPMGLETPQRGFTRAGRQDAGTSHPASTFADTRGQRMQPRAAGVGARPRPMPAEDYAAPMAPLQHPDAIDQLADEDNGPPLSYG
jgi:hypothetical protein